MAINRSESSVPHISRGYSATSPLRRGPGTPIQPAPSRTPVRTFEIAGLRPDGSLYIGQNKAPDLPLFDSAFSALARGSLLQTEHGLKAIEDLLPGDRLVTNQDDLSQVVWIGSSTFVPSEIGHRVPMVRIVAESFGLGRPAGFLSLGPAARLLRTPHHMLSEADGRPILANVQEFVDGENVIAVVPPTPVRLFHICLRKHAVVYADGLEVETYHPGIHATRTLSHQMRSLFLSMFPHIQHMNDFGPLAYRRLPADMASDCLN